MANVFYIIPIFICSTLWLSVISSMGPSISESNESLKFPTSLEDLFKLSKLLKLYLEKNKSYMYTLFISAYLYKQAFCIPGSALLNVLAGALFGLYTALPLCCLLTGFGATFSYLISRTFADHLVVYFWSKEVDLLKSRIARQGDKLFFYLLSLRLMPLTPNWLLNLISPIIGVPLPMFFITVFLGLIPYNYICIQAGAMLTEITSFNDVFTWKIVIQLSGLAGIVFTLPRLIGRNSEA